MPDLSEQILAAVGRKSYAPLKPKALARKIGVPQKLYGEFRKALRELVRQGRVQFGKNHAVRPAGQHGTVVGVYRRTSTGLGFVRPHVVEGKAGADIAVPADAALDASTGDEVLVKVVSKGRGEAVIIEVLGPRGRPGVDTLSIIREYGLPDAFPDDVLEEARAAADAFREDDLAGRTDFTRDLVITIDPADARDFDDAVSLTYDSRSKHWLPGVHIADVGHFAPPGGALDREARGRATSVYLPQRVIPMFPEIISNHLASLQQGKVRYV